MPELPEVETTRRGIEPHVVGRRVVSLALHEPRLRWRVPNTLPAKLAGQRIRLAGRRAKYLLIELEGGTLLLHLGMSGSLRVLPAETPRIAHDHFDLMLDSGNTLRFNDPRRFGSLHYTTEAVEKHPLLARLAPEPFDDGIRCGLSLAHHAPAQCRDQTADHEQHARGRGRQHLRQRSAVSRAHPAAPAGAQSFAR